MALSNSDLLTHTFKMHLIISIINILKQLYKSMYRVYNIIAIKCTNIQLYTFSVCSYAYIYDFGFL